MKRWGCLAICVTIEVQESIFGGEHVEIGFERIALQRTQRSYRCFRIGGAKDEEPNN